MPASRNTEIGRVLRVGRGWIDVTIDRKVRRVGTRRDLLIRAGSYIQIANDRAVAVLPASEFHASNQLQ